MTKVMEANIDNTKDTITHEQELEKIFSNVNNWLKFAEARHAMLLALNGTFLFHIVANQNLWLSTTLIFVSISSSLFSFLIDLFNEQYINNDKKSKKNLLFYKDIAKYPISSYEHYISDLFGKHSNYTKLEKYYSEEIIINSQITYRKYRWFKISLIFFILATLTTLYSYKNHLITTL